MQVLDQYLYNVLNISLPSSGIWPVMSFYGHKNEGSLTESSGKPESPPQEPKPEKKVEVETERSVPSVSEEATADEEKEVLKTEKDEQHPETAEKVDAMVSEHGKVESDSQTMLVEPPESTVQNLESSDSMDNQQQKETLDTGTCEETESGEAKSGPVEADKVKVGDNLPDELDSNVDTYESKSEEKIEESEDVVKTQAEEILEEDSPVKAEVSSIIQSEVGSEPSDLQSVRTEETESAHELPSPSVFSPDAASDTVSQPVSPENDAKIKSVEAYQQPNDSGIDNKEQHLSPEANVSVSADSVLELEKLKLEMKMMETALQGAARQAQVLNMQNYVIWGEICISDQPFLTYKNS